MQSVYTTVYDVTTTTPIPAAAPLLFAMMFVIGVGVALANGHPAAQRIPILRGLTPVKMIQLGGVVAFLSFCLGGITTIEYSGRERLVSAIRRGDSVLVEGRVAGFVPGDSGAHTDESWRVEAPGSAHYYRYSRSSYEPGFHQSAGPVRAGQRVRVTDVDGQIARLEIATEDLVAR
jgi:hypothetical protein